MRIEMERFRVGAGKEAGAREWIAFLRENPEAFRETLEPERMYVETIFSGTVGDALYLWWYTLQGEDGAAGEVTKSIDPAASITLALPAERLRPMV